MKVIRKGVILVILFWVFGQSNAQEEPVPRKIDSLAFERTLKDLGDIVEGCVISHKFEFTNAYNRMVNLSILEKSCNCTDVILSKKDLNANDQGYIELIVDTTGKCGAFYSYVIISANTKQKFYKIGIKGNVINCNNTNVK